MKLQKGDRVETESGRQGTVKWLDNGQAKVAWDSGQESYVVLNPGLKVTPAHPVSATTSGGFKVSVIAYEGDMAQLRYVDGSTGWRTTDDLIIEEPAPAPEPEKKEVIRVGDRVRHSRKVDPWYRRLGGRVMSVNVTGRSVVVRWDGVGSYREELVSQLEVVHRAEKVEPTPMEQVIQLLDAEGELVSAEIDRLLARLQAINAAKAALA